MRRSRLARLLPVLMGGGASAPITQLNLTTGLATWNAAKATGHPFVWMYGDSVMHGDYLDDVNDGWAQQLEAQIHTLYGTGGHYYTAKDAASWTVGANWAASVNLAAQGSTGDTDGFTHSTDATDTLVLTATGKYYDIYYYVKTTATATGPFTMQLDSGEPVAGKNKSTATMGYYKETLTAAAEGEHTITITPGNVTGDVVYCLGITVRNAAGGAIVFNASYGGNLTTSYNAGWLQLAVLEPTLTIFALDINDFKATTQTALATYSTRVNTMLTSNMPTASVLLIAENPSSVVKTIPQTDYHAELLALAQTTGCAYINIHQLMGGSWAAAYANGYMDNNAAGQNHPNIAGHLFQYNEIEPYITAV